MRILIDTDIALWATLKTDALSPIAKDFLLSSGNEIFYSVISIWEVSLKHSINPENMEITASEFRQLCQDSGFIEIPLEYHHILGLDRLTQKEGCPVHKDPIAASLILTCKNPLRALENQVPPHTIRAPGRHTCTACSLGSSSPFLRRPAL